MYAKILEQRTRAKTEHLLSDAQFGFRKGRGCTDAIFALQQLCERAIEHDQDLHLVFVDQEKAFDRVNRDKLWKVLEQYDVKGQLLDNIRAIYTNCRRAARSTNGTSDCFPVTSGVRQGRNLSPLLFVIYMDQITKKANPDPESLSELMFADYSTAVSVDTQPERKQIDMSVKDTDIQAVTTDLAYNDEIDETTLYKFDGASTEEECTVSESGEECVQNCQQMNDFDSEKTDEAQSEITTSSIAKCIRDFRHSLKEAQISKRVVQEQNLTRDVS